jgi:hypothetical protein
MSTTTKSVRRGPDSRNSPRICHYGEHMTPALVVIAEDDIHLESQLTARCEQPRYPCFSPRNLAGSTRPLNARNGARGESAKDLPTASARSFGLRPVKRCPDCGVSLLDGACSECGYSWRVA